jgi:tRNA threonylcarbamoyl adenosine modification protein (Sua5/YciO/YrdC/YwlC family)
MCPGGQVVAAASEQGGVCVNGMSNHARNGQNANSALLVEVRPEDLPGQNVLEGVAFQRKLERAAFELGGKTYKAPAQTVGSFMRAQGAATARVNKAGARTLQVEPTYPRGVVTADLRKCLPPLVTNALAEALPALDKKLPGFADPAAVMTAVEARSSSPVRIVRNKQTLESVTAAGVYPCGEGAGYAGGIMSAAVDGIRVAEAIITKISSAPHEVFPGESGVQAPVPQPTAHPQVTPSPTFEQAAAMLRAGAPLIFPTDTVFGLGVAATATTSPQALFRLKNRPQNKPVAWLIANAQDLQKYGEGVPEYAFELAKQHWPGALTLIVKVTGAVPAQFASAQGTIGLRVPAHAALRRLIEAAGAPLATTSANVSGHAPASSASEIPQELAAQVAIYTFADQPECSQPAKVAFAQNAAHAAPSTVIDCTGPAPKIIRP